MECTHLIAFFSPAGTTRQVAETVRQRLLDRRCQVEVIDLGAPIPTTGDRLDEKEGPARCLWLGSPVYCDHVVPVVSDWIKKLAPAGERGYAVPLVTWGGVTSGVALSEMSGALQAKQYTPLAAGKVLAVHSSMWQVPEPLGLGHPDQEDLAQVRTLVDVVVDRLAANHLQPLDLHRLEYLSPAMRAEARSKSLAKAKAGMPPLTVEQQRCTCCGTCADICPTRAITLAPYPVVGASCVLCMQCVRTCPEIAFPWNAEVVAARIREMASRSDEEKATAFFY